MSWNLFDGGRIRNNIKAEDALAVETRVRYEQTVLFALQEVEDSHRRVSRTRSSVAMPWNVRS